KANESYFLFQDQRPVDVETVRAFFYGPLPPGKSYEEKVLMGAYFEDTLIAIFDFLKDWPEEKNWAIGLMVVDEKWRGKGVGKELLTDLGGFFRINSVNKLRLGVLADNQPARSFWFANNFNFIGHTELDPAGREILVMEKEI
ncbi:MAG: GNAT family N-acetyltransferase, partial [Saprospiraceae bacterium]|nr:GNAT family N-acetyltransferase [Saprospiraceae bacterium]